MTPKNGVAGIGCLIIDGKKRRIFSNWIKLPNNNVGELYAIYYVLMIAGSRTGPHTGHYQINAINNAMADLLTKEGIVKYLNSVSRAKQNNRNGR